MTDAQEDIKELQIMLDKFITQYELDMRGDKKLGNGEKGMVNEIRDIKEYHNDYPSITWLLKNKTTTTVSTICGVGLTIFSLGFIMIIVFGPTELASSIFKLLGIPL